MKKRYGVWLLFAALVGTLLIAIAAAGIAFAFARMFYSNENAIRLDPMGLAAYPQSLMPAQPNTRRLVFFGDSRAAAWSPPVDLAGWEFVNRGISGQTTAQILGRFSAHVVPLHPQVILLQLGINDLRNIPIFPASRASLIANTITNIQSIIRQSNDLGATVILTTIFPVTEPGLDRRLFFWSDDIGLAAREANQSLRTFASDHVLILDAEQLLSAADGRARPEFMEDSLHLNPAGYDLLNQHLAPILATLP